MTPTVDPRALAAHVLRALAASQAKGRTTDLARLAETVGVRRTDVRAVVSRLHAEGHVDALRLRLTMSGLAVVAALAPCKLAPVRAPVRAAALVAACA